MGVSIAVGVFLIGWVMFLFNLVFNIYKSFVSKKWIKVDASVQYVLMNESYDDGSTTYKVLTKYSYTIDSKPYTNDTIYYGYLGHSIKKYHEAIKVKLQNALIVTAYVNPLNPKQSVLCSFVMPWSKIVLMLFLGMMMFRALMFLYPSKSEMLNPLWIGLLCILVIVLLIKKKSVADSIEVIEYKPKKEINN